MKWVTRERPKTDRIACPWLIKSFIDSEAEFLYVPAGQVLAAAEREGAHSYDAPGAALVNPLFNLVDLTNAAGDDLTPAWSPISVGKIAFASNRSGQFGIFTMPAAGGSPLALTSDQATDREPSWSPDGTKITFSSNRATSSRRRSSYPHRSVGWRSSRRRAAPRRRSRTRPQPTRIPAKRRRLPSAPDRAPVRRHPGSPGLCRFPRRAAATRARPP